MAIEKKNIKDVSTSIRSMYQKAKGVLDKNELDYGIELLKQIVQCDPGFLEARDALREAERTRSDKIGAFSKFFAQMKSGKFVVRAKANAAKNAKGALSDVEEALALYLYSPVALNALADIAKTAGAEFISVEALEILREKEPDNEPNLVKLCGIYEDLKDGNNVLKIRQKLADLHPDSLELQAKVREAAAMATMTGTAWGVTSSNDENNKKKADEKQGDKIIRAEEDILAEIANAEE